MVDSVRSDTGSGGNAVVQMGQIGDVRLITIVAAILVVFVTSVLFLIYRRFAVKANTILLVGLNDAGKSVIFGKLINSKNLWTTYMSMTENIFRNYLTKDGLNCVLVDVPGAESVRKNRLIKWLINERKTVKCVIFVVDAASFTQKCKDAAELLYDVVFESNRSIPILVACNKQDNQLKAKSSKIIASELEKEFGLINLSRASSLSSTSGDSTNKLLTPSGANFRWAELGKRGGRPLVSYAECCAEEDGKSLVADDDESAAKLTLNQIRNWIDSL